MRLALASIVVMSSISLIMSNQEACAEVAAISAAISNQEEHREAEVCIYHGEL